MDTLLVNMFGGPGAGKSTLAALLHGELKRLGVLSELVTEYPKELTWEGDMRRLMNQPLIFGTMLDRTTRLIGKVEVIVTDSPLLLQVVWAERNGFPGLAQDANRIAATFWNLNVMVERVSHYDTRGRNESAEEAIRLDAEVRAIVQPVHAVSTTSTADVVGLSSQVLDVLWCGQCG